MSAATLHTYSTACPVGTYLSHLPMSLKREERIFFFHLSQKSQVSASIELSSTLHLIVYQQEPCHLNATE
jgi:hypothetical protein